MTAYNQPPRFAALESYWRDPSWFDRQKAQGQAEIDALFNSFNARQRAKQEERWQQDMADEALRMEDGDA